MSLLLLHNTSAPITSVTPVPVAFVVLTTITTVVVVATTAAAGFVTDVC